MSIFGHWVRERKMRMLALLLVAGVSGCESLASSDQVGLLTDQVRYQLPLGVLPVTVTNRTSTTPHWVPCPSPFWLERREIGGWELQPGIAALCANSILTIDLDPKQSHRSAVLPPGRAGVYRVGFSAAVGTRGRVSAYSAPF